MLTSYGHVKKPKQKYCFFYDFRLIVSLQLDTIIIRQSVASRLTPVIKINSSQFVEAEGVR